LLASNIETTRVDKQFKDLNLLMRESSRGPAAVDSILQKIQELQIFVAEIAMAPDAGKKSFEVAKARFESGSSNPVTALKAYATTLPDPVNRWLTDLADQSWKVILGSANGYVSSEWRSRVYTPYAQVLAGKYPLNPSSSDEVAMLDFSAFFKPGGTIDQFNEEFLLPFIDTKNGWRNKGVDNFSLGISASALTQLSNAMEIKRMFFQAGGEFPSVELELRPLNMSEKHSRFTLELGDTHVEYKHGPKFWKPIKWSGGDDSLRLRIIFEDLTDSIHEKTFTGPWALFRLLDASKITKTAASNVYLIAFSVIDNGNMENQISYEAKTKSVNNPLRRGLLTAFKCPERI
jgi:type VI secretion system protein ImpL